MIRWVWRAQCSDFEITCIKFESKSKQMSLQQCKSKTCSKTKTIQNDRSSQNKSVRRCGSVQSDLFFRMNLEIQTNHKGPFIAAISFLSDLKPSSKQPCVGAVATFTPRGASVLTSRNCCVGPWPNRLNFKAINHYTNTHQHTSYIRILYIHIIQIP